VIELNHISSGYKNNLVIDDLTLCFEAGKLTSVVGINGSGKSTLLKTILGMIPASSGEIRIDGKSLSDLSRTEIAKKAAFLTQGKDTPDMTVEQLVLHGRFPHLRYPRRYTQHDRDITRSAMERVGIADCAAKPLQALSGGMRQNAYIAMTLAQNTDYILLDEPTTYLDISHQLELMRTLRTLADSGKGIVAVMHDLPMAFTFSDRIVLLHKGKIVANGTPEQISQPDTLQEIFGVSLSAAPDGHIYHYRYRI